ncbi:hypothetical protein [Jiulongibacter sediminis]|uniref:Uncharacterized protein n=1 Tax=Jiulongibacter sediminis TaxID=1605367 RepID=A0A0P7BR46_9BACT|nr:hypothetical protein [Jiulongibacter sediminis]KPM47558.1 hypothetical protein AFM12_13730 [Jiulongibacter sediminis]TBX23352.1 hypothetical protein TK44_13740 [Jiulongibacter sediminis]
MKLILHKKIKCSFIILWLLQPCSLAEAKNKLFTKVTADTTAMNYYSFNDHREIEYSRFLALARSQVINICEKGEVYLKAPDLGKTAEYEWKGPHGFQSIGKDVLLQNLFPEHSGYYTAHVAKAGKEYNARIKLNVFSLPLYKIGKTEFRPSEKVFVATEIIEPETNYSWLDMKGRELSRLPSLELGARLPGKEYYYFRAERNGCAVKSLVEILISAYEAAPKKSVTEMLRSIK